MTYQGKLKRNLFIVVCFIAIIGVSNIVMFHLLDLENIQHVSVKKHDFASAEPKSEDSKTNNKTGKIGQNDKKDTKDNKGQQGQEQEHHEVAGLSCADHGGPSNEIAEEMVFWSDIESDSNYKSPFYDEEKYITFEPDPGGWNNIRMSMETILVLAHAMGRTLVLPPKKLMYLLGNSRAQHENEFSFNDFFHLDAIALEHQGLNIITMEEFLKRKGVTGQLKSIESGEAIKPPDGITNWDGKQHFQLWRYLEKVGKFPKGWSPGSCVAAIPASNDPNDVSKLQTMMDEIIAAGNLPDPGKGAFDGEPTPVDAPTKERLKEMLATRKNICIYDTELQKEELIHFKIDHSEKARMLTHFYAFVFFQDWVSFLSIKKIVIIVLLLTPSLCAI